MKANKKGKTERPPKKKKKKKGNEPIETFMAIRNNLKGPTRGGVRG
jgi:hypothetical protein